MFNFTDSYDEIEFLGSRKSVHNIQYLIDWHPGHNN